MHHHHTTNHTINQGRALERESVRGGLVYFYYTHVEQGSQCKAAKYGGGGEEEEAKMETEELNNENDQGTQGSLEGKNDGENNDNHQAVTITIPTKVEDGGTIRVEEVQVQEDNNNATNDNEQQQGQGQEHLAPLRRDTFRRYSNTNTRMWHLLGNDDPEANNEDNTDWQQVTGYQNRRQLRAGVDPNNDERRTRLSTELYPDVFLRDLT